MGRRAWLFAATPKGAQASAVLYSTVLCAKANGLDPYDYLRTLFERLPIIDPEDTAAIEALDNTQFGGRTLRVNEAHERKGGGGRGGGMRGGGGFSRGGGGFSRGGGMRGGSLRSEDNPHRALAIPGRNGDCCAGQYLAPER